jgi:1A family penicillin-binding protein
MAKARKSTTRRSSPKKTHTRTPARNSRFGKRRKPLSKQQKAVRRKTILKIMGIIAISGLLLAIIGATATFAYFAKDLPDPEKLIARDVAETTKIYDRDEKVVLYEIHGEKNRTLINIEELPDYIKLATVAVEDDGFYNHKGFDLRGIFRAVLVNVRSERSAQGGSTITQQLVKNAVLTREKTYTRKIKELILSIQIERKFSKEEILQLYLNEIPYGSNAYGVYAAADTFFKKHPRDLTISEAALLASLPNAPTFFSPYGSNVEALMNRHQWTIGRMETLGYITPEEAEEARNQELQFSSRQDAGIIAPHFVFYVREQLERKYGTKAMEQGGLKVVTTLHYDMQLSAERAISNHVDFIKRYGAGNAALGAIDPKTGEILAMVGSKDYFNVAEDGNVNVTTSLRQPGSSFKPYVYATAFAKGLTPDTIVYDLETDFGDNYKPRNYDLSQSGPIRLKNALARSLNIPAVKVAYVAGMDDVVDLARKLGIESFPEGEFYGLSTAIGGKEVRLIDHVGAFGVFANQGRKIPKTGILRVTNNRGDILEQHDPEAVAEQAIDGNVANTVNNVLSDRNLRVGTFRALNLSRENAAKTGTTNDFKDAWTMGYTPNLSAGVWVGNNDGGIMNRGADGSIVATPIWKEFMEAALQHLPTENFVKPSPIPTENSYARGAREIEEVVKLCKPSMKLANEHCPAHLIEERTYREAHSILHYIDRNNIAGPPPSNPKADPLYNNFEGPVRAWAEKNGESLEAKPTEVDLSHNPENLPKITITSPGNNDTIEKDTITISADASGANGVKQVDFYVGSTLIQSDAQAPYSTFYTVNVANGFHTIRAVVTDRADNTAETSIKVNFKIAREKPVVTMLAPGGSVTISETSFPYTLSASVAHIASVASVTFYYKPSSGDSIVIGSVSAPTSSGQYNLSWGKSPGPGTYSIYANAKAADGEVTRSNTTTLTITGTLQPSPDKIEPKKD